MGRIVLGEGALPARCLFIGEGPGEAEDRTGRPFMGKSGDVLDRYWGRGGVPAREDVYLTNVVKVRCVDARGKNRKPTQAEIDEWAPMLDDEIEACRPQVIVTMGATATSLYLQHDLDSVHGIPHRIYDVEDQGVSIVIFPTYHPAASLHDPTLQALLTYDFQQLGKFLKGELQARTIQTPDLTIADGWVGMNVTQPDRIYAALDTEGWADEPWGLSYCDTPWRGQVVRASQEWMIDSLADLLRSREYGVEAILHYALHDLPVLRALGIDLVEMGIPIHDTMVASYLLGLEPRGLKALCYRHLGMEMDSYEDLTREAEQRVTFQYLTDLIAGLPDKPIPKSKRRKGEIVDDSPTLVDLGKAKDLLIKMVSKSDDGLRKRWLEGRAREILVGQYGLPDMPRTTLDDVEDQDRVIQYAGADAIGTRGIFFPLMEQIDAYQLRDCYETTVGIIPMVDRMQQIGMLVDRGHFEALGPVLEARGEELDAQIEQMIGVRINCNSGDQVAPILFDRLRLQHKARNIRLKKTDGGRYSTDDKTLEALEDLHPLVPLIRQRREVTKLKGTYVDPAAAWIAADGRLHPTLKLTATDTGRLAAEDPNILAFPKHSEWAKLIRYGFIAAPGHLLMSCDLDQIELRVLAHDANDRNMIAEFLSGRDKHASTAALIFGRDYDELFSAYKSGDGEAGEQRFAAKAVNFGTVMGITAHGLRDQFHKNGQLHWTTDDCERLLAEGGVASPEASQYQYDKHAEARRYGYVRDMFGRLRWIDGVHSDDPYVIAGAERMAQATPIQSGAQGIMQRIMCALWPHLVTLRRQYWVEPLLQVHDDLIFELEEPARDTVRDLVLHHMSNTVTLRVPVTAKPTFGHSWGEL